MKANGGAQVYCRQKDLSKENPMLTDTQFGEYAEKYIDTVYRVAFSMLKNPHDADDVTQEVFLKLYTAYVEFQSEAHVKNWLIKVTVNACRNVFRTPWRKVEDIEEYAQTLGFETPEQSDLFLAVNSLDRKYRIAVHLYYFEGYSVKEIAQTLNRQVSTITTWMSRGRKKLKDYLEREGLN